MTVGHSEDSISRIASTHGITASVRDLLYENGGRLPLGDVSERLGENESLVIEGIENQHNGSDPWVVGDPWVRITTETDEETGEEVKLAELTDNGREATESEPMQTDLGYKTGIGYSGKSV